MHKATYCVPLCNSKFDKVFRPSRPLPTWMVRYNYCIRRPIMRLTWLMFKTHVIGSNSPKNMSTRSEKYKQYNDFVSLYHNEQYTSATANNKNWASIVLLPIRKSLHGVLLFLPKSRSLSYDTSSLGFRCPFPEFCFYLVCNRMPTTTICNKISLSSL